MSTNRPIGQQPPFVATHPTIGALPRASFTLREKVLDGLLHRQPSRVVQKSPSDQGSPLPGLRMLPSFSYRRSKNHKQALQLEASSPVSQVQDLGSDQSEITPERSRSPLDKPLPKIPTDAIDFNPELAHISLIDATEKSLLGQMSPREVKDWPTLSPRRQEKQPLEPSKAAPNKVSLSESVIERVRKLNLNDVDDTESIGEASDGRHVTPRSTPRMMRASHTENAKRDPSSGRTALTSHQSTIDQSDAERRALTPTKLLFTAKAAQSAASAKSTTPVVRQTRTSELRKRLTSNPLSGSEPKKPKPNHSTLIVSSTVVVPTLRSDHADKVKNTVARSHSKHRVTSKGSPYTIVRSAHESITDTNIPSLDLSADTENDGISGTTSDHGTAQVEDHVGKFRKSQSFEFSNHPAHYQSPGTSLRSSLSAPKYHTRKKSISDSEADITPLFTRKSTSSKHESDLGDDGDIDTDSNRRRGRRSRRASQVDRTSFVTEIHEAKVAVRARAKADTSPEKFRSHGDIHSVRAVSPSAQSLAGTIYGEDEYEKFKVKPLSRSAPKHGPQLRVSLSANEFLLGVSTSDSDIASAPIRKTTISKSDGVHANRPARQLMVEDAIGEDPEDGITSGKEEISAVSDDMGRDHTGGETGNHNHDESWYTKVKNLAVKTQQAIAAAPPVEPGIPQDKSKKIGWPFNESVVVPFKPLELIPLPNDNDQAADQQGQANGPETSRANKDETRIDDAAMTGLISSTGAQDHEKNSYRVLANLEQTHSWKRGRNEPLHGSEVANGRNPRVYHEPPPVKPSAAQALPSSSLPRNIKSWSRSGRRVAQLTQTPSTYNSPTSAGGLDSGGKGVIRNIKGLFHRRGIENKVPIQDSPASTGISSSRAKKSDHLSTAESNPKPRIPRSPRVRDTTPTLYERRQARLDQNPFLRNRDGITVATTFSPKSMKRSNRQSSGQHEVQDRKTLTTDNVAIRMKLPDEAAHDPTPKAQEPTELASATLAVHEILNRAQDEDHTTKKLEYIELSKLMVQALHMARDAEKAKEQARHFATKAELECMKTRKEIIRVAEMVEKMLNYEQ